VHLSIEIEPGSDPIRGVIRGPGAGDSHCFCGWIELVSRIEVARSVAEGPVDSSDDDH
jgi:hypothetical protein